VQYITQEACRLRGIDLNGATVAVQGFGNVGSVAARLLSEAGATVVAVSDANGAIHDPAGIDVAALVKMPHEHGFIPEGYAGERITNEELLELPVDILVPAALEGQIHGRNAARIQAKIIVEAANGPTTPEADRILNERGIFIVPDIVANAGGVIVSYFEWVQDLQSFFWEEQEVVLRLEKIIKRSYKEVADIQQQHNITMREAAYTLAVQRVVDAITVRGIFP
jgi:glutamate dehydrogenase (NAD(P)+)